MIIINQPFCFTNHNRKPNLDIIDFDILPKIMSD